MFVPCNPTRPLPVLLLAVCLVLGARAQQTPTPPAEPPAPAASVPVQALLADAAKRAAAQKPAEALAQAERALAAAQAAKDMPGEARAHAQRGALLETLRKPAGALAAWQAAAAAWRAAGDGPGEVEALLQQVLLRDPETMRAPLAAAIARAQGETRRPGAAAALLHNLGITFYNRGRLEETRRLWTASLALFEKLTPGSLAVAGGLNNLGNVVLDQGDLAGSKDYYRRALAIQEKLAPDSLAVATTLGNLGLVASTEGDLPGSREYRRRALAIQEKLAPDSLHVARSLAGLGSVAYYQGDLVVAQEYHRRALALREKLAPGSLDVASSLNNLGNVASAQGDLVAAKAYYRRDLALTERLAPGSLDVASGLHNLGALAFAQGDPVGAKEYFQRALTIREKLAPGSLEVSGTLHDLGNVADEQGDVAGAKEYYQRALAIRERLAPDSLDVAGSLLNLGNVAHSQGDAAGAKALWLRALAIAEKQAPGSLDVADSLDNLGNLAHEQGDAAGAREYHGRALSLREKLAPGSLAVATSLNSLGVMAADQGDPARAKEYFERALAIQEKLAPGSLVMAGTLYNLGKVARREGATAAAVQSLQRAWDLVRRQARQVSGDESRRAFGSANTAYAAELQQALLARGDRAGALRVFEEGRAQALQQVLAERGLERLADPAARAAHAAAFNTERIARAVYARALDREQRVGALLAEAVQQPEAARAPLRVALEAAVKETQAARSALTQSRLSTERAWSRVKATGPRAALADPLPFDRARAALRPGDLFLAYSVGARDTTLFLVTGAASTPVETFTLPVQEAAWKREVAGLTRQVTDPNSSASGVRSRGLALAGRLLPARAVMRVRQARRVIVSPDGVLWETPFAVLVLPGTGREPEQYLGLAKPLVYAQSLSLYARSLKGAPTASAAGAPAVPAVTVGGCLFSAVAIAAARSRAGGPALARVPAPEAKPAAGGGLLAGGGVLLASRGAGRILRGGEGDWPSLPATGPEAAGIARLYRGRSLSGLAATEAEIRKLLGRAGVIHLATHGRYHIGDVLLSGLIVTQPGPGEQVTEATDGVLEAAELLDPALRVRAEVVVLSGCRTGRGVQSRGEGLVGLTRCWEIAGARSVVASQWSVADASTVALMLTFHRGLRAGRTKDEAMRRAMLEVARTKQWAHPFFWAPFLVTGDPRGRRSG